jgi:hypothetical protein
MLAFVHGERAQRHTAMRKAVDRELHKVRVHNARAGVKLQPLACAVFHPNIFSPPSRLGSAYD